MTTQKYIITTPCYSLREIDLRDAQQILEKHGFTFSRIHFEEANALNVYQLKL